MSLIKIRVEFTAKQLKEQDQIFPHLEDNYPRYVDNILNEFREKLVTEEDSLRQYIADLEADTSKVNLEEIIKFQEAKFKLITNA